MSRKIITDDMLQTFTTLVGKKSYKEIGELLGVSKTIVYKMSCITGLKPTEEQKRSNKLRVQSYNPEVNRFLELAKTHSYSEIASIMGVTLSNVKYFAARSGYRRSKEDASKFLSNSVTSLNKKERRRMLFGLSQQTNKHLFLNPKLATRKQKYRNGLRRYGYIISVGSNDVIVPEGLNRHRRMEANAVALGFKFIEQTEKRLSI